MWSENFLELDSFCEALKSIESGDLTAVLGSLDIIDFNKAPYC